VAADGLMRLHLRDMVGVGCRRMVIGRRSGTLLSTLQPTPMCVSWAHAVVPFVDERALAEGLPHQTLISSLLHKYASGWLKEF
jgi:hypothetical protein